VTGRLDGVQGIQPDLHQVGDQRLEPAATVHLDLQPVFVSQVNQPLDMRQHEAFEQFGAQQRAGLASEIVADEEDVDQVARLVKDPAARRRVEIDHVRHQRIDQAGLVVHLHVEILHPQQIDRVMPERRPVTAQDGILVTPGRRLLANAGDIHASRIGPRVGMHVIQRCVRQRMR